MVSVDLVWQHFQLQPIFLTCQNFFDRSSLRSTGARDQKKKAFLSSCLISGSSTLYSVFNSTAYTGRTVIRGFSFHKNCFFDITFVCFGFVEWDAPRFSTALTKLDDRGLSHKVLLLSFFAFSLLRVSGYGQNNGIIKHWGALGGTKKDFQQIQQERKMEDAGRHWPYGFFSLLSFST